MSPLRRLWNVLRRSRMDDDLRQELDTHLALIEEEERRQGLTAEQARQKARAGSGTAVDRNTGAIYEAINPGRTRTFDVNAGFVHSQASRGSFQITGAKKTVP